MKCELCELQEICNLAEISSYTIITCEAFKNAVRKYGGKEKLIEEIYNLINESVLYKEEKQNVNQPITYDRFLQGVSRISISEGTDKDGLVLYSSNVSSGRCG